MAEPAGQLQMEVPSLPPLERPYIDSSVFMAHIKKETIPCRETTRLDITSNLFKGAQDGKYKLYTSFLTLAEVRRIKQANKELTPDELIKARGLFQRFLEHAWIQPIQVDRMIAEKAQQLGADYGMSPTDAIHLASAILAHCNVLLVWDKGKFSDLFKDDPIEGVHVLEPYWEGIIPMKTS